MTEGGILQMEDDENDIFLIEELFTQAGIKNPIHVVTNGQMAIDYLAGIGAFADRKKYPLPCLVLTDLKLPKKSGLEVLEWIRQQPELRKLVVIIFSSSALPSDVNRAYELGANCFVVKPVEFEETAEFVKLVKDFWLSVNRFAEIRS
jgi:CheY-like chemotaxis protein